MSRNLRLAGLVLLLLILTPVVALAVVEPKTEKEYPDELTLQVAADQYTLYATGVALREKTFMKVDVYTIVSYAKEDRKYEGDKGMALAADDMPKRLQMDLTRGFSADKLKKSFSEAIDENFEDQTAFAADMETFLAYWTRDAQEGDQIIFDYHPVVGLTTTLNGEVMGTIENLAFVEALWSVWFGEEPASDGMKKALLSNI